MPFLSSLEHIKNIEKPINVSDSGLFAIYFGTIPTKKLMDGVKIKEELVLLLKQNMYQCFVKKKQDLHLICRAHQVV